MIYLYTANPPDFLCFSSTATHAITILVEFLGLVRELRTKISRLLSLHFIQCLFALSTPQAISCLALAAPVQ
jgi:hypothetical protein